MLNIMLHTGHLCYILCSIISPNYHSLDIIRQKFMIALQNSHIHRIMLNIMLSNVLIYYDFAQHSARISRNTLKIKESAQLEMTTG